MLSVFSTRWRFYGEFLDAQGNLTTTGAIYLNHISTPSVPESLVNSYVNNLYSRMNEITTINNLLPDKERLDYHFNTTNKNLTVNSVTLDSINLLNVQGMYLKQITSNKTTSLNGLPNGVYILMAQGFRPEKILIN